MRWITNVLAGAALAALSVLPVQAQEKLVKMGSMAWEDLHASSIITKKFLEKQGYKVELKTFSEWGIAFGALQKGDVEILSSEIDYIASDYWSKSKNRLEKLSVFSHGVYQGLVVPSYMDIDSVEQLNEVADKVGGKIIGVEPGTGLMRETHNAVKDYGLNYKVIDGSTAAMTAQLQASLERKEPIVTMLWTPSWMDSKFDVRYLKDPKGSFAPPQGYYWVGKKGVVDNDARLRQSIATVYIPFNDIVEMMTVINEGKTVEEAAEGWWNDNQEIVAKWAEMSAD